MRTIFNWITTVSLRFRWLVFAMTAVVLVLGVQAWTQMKQELLPPVEFPASFVVATAAGMTSTQALHLYTEPLEAAFSKIDDIVNIESNTSPGFVFFNLANEFGKERGALDAELQTAIDSIWLPIRELRAPVGETGHEFSSRLLGDVDGATWRYLAAADPTLLLNLSPATWDLLSAEALISLLPFFATQTSSIDTSATPLENFITQEVIPSLLANEEIADASISGGESIDRLRGANTNDSAANKPDISSSLLLQLDEESWEIIASKVGLSEKLDLALAAELATDAVAPPTSPPNLPTSWQSNTESRFRNADDLLEIVSLNNSLADLLNNFARQGWLRGPLGQTDDLSVEIIERMLEIDPSFALSFGEEHLLALPEELLVRLPKAVRQPEEAGLRNQLLLRELGNIIAGREGAPEAVDLPTAWRTALPSILQFSLSDFPVAIFSISGDIRADEVAVPAPPAAATTENLDTPPPRKEGPPLPAIFSDLGANFGIEMDTADDMLAIDLPPQVSAQFGMERIDAATLMNTVAQLAGATATNNCPSETQPALPALFTSGALVSCMDAESLIWLATNDTNFLPNLTADFYSLLPDDSLLSLNNAGFFAPPLGGNGWERLLADHHPGPINTDSLTALAISPAAALNQIAALAEQDEFSVVATRLLDELSPLAMRILHLRDEDFLSELDPAVWLGLSRETLVSLDTAIQNLRASDEELMLKLQDIIAGAPTAAEELALANAGSAPTYVEGPTLSDDWEPLGNFYGVELNSADDFIRFQEVIGTPAVFMNRLFLSPQGTAIAPALFANLSYEALAYLAAEDENFLLQMSAEALQLLPADLLLRLETLSPGIGERAKQTNISPIATITRSNSAPSLLLSVFKTRDANTVRSFRAIETDLAALKGTHPNLLIEPVFEQAQFIEESITGVAREGALGALFTIVIILLFLSDGRWAEKRRRTIGILSFSLFSLGLLLIVATNWSEAGGDPLVAFNEGDIILRVLLIIGVLFSLVVLFLPRKLPSPAWRSTLVTTISIPLSLLAALAMLHYLPNFVHQALAPFGPSPLIDFILKLFPRDVTLNIMVLSGLTVAIGRVVDDSIVVLENIFRQMQLSHSSSREAIITGTRDVSVAIFTATIVAVVVFLPLGLTGGLISEFFLPFGIAVTYALLASFIVAIVVVPALSSLFIRQEDIVGEEAGPIAGAVMHWYLPFLSWGLKRWRNVGLVVAGALISMVIGFTLFGLRPFAFLPALGEPQIAVNIELPIGTSILETNDKVLQLEEFVHKSDGWSNGSPGETSEIRNILSEVGSAGGNTRFLGTENVSGNRANMTLTLRSNDVTDSWIVKLRDEAETIFASEMGNSVTAETQVDYCDSEWVQGEGPPPTGREAKAYRVSSASDGLGVGGFQLIISGKSELLNRLNACIIETLEGIDGLVNISSNITSSEANDIERATYIRIDGRSALLFSGELETENSIGVTTQAIETIENLPILLSINDGLPTEEQIIVSQGFDSEVQTEGFVSVGRSMLLALIIVILILIVTFGSPVYWLVIIFSVIVAPVGAAIALTLTNRVLGISALIGLLMLIGIVITNAVVLIDRVQTNRRQRGMATRQALLEAGERRLRPILMTSLATIIALLPLAVGLSEGAIVASEMGTVVIGGVLGSTLLTLIVVPVAYMLFNPAHEYLMGRFRPNRREGEEV